MALKLSFLSFLLFAFAFMSLAMAAERHFVILVDTHENDSAGRGGDLDYDDGWAIKALKKQFPMSEIALIRPTSNQSLKQQLQAYSEPNVKIDGLELLSHGSSSMNPDKPYDSKVSSQDDKFLVHLTDKKSVESAFGPLVGHFSDGAKLIFEGCSLVSAGDLQQKYLAMKIIADNFGLKSGSVYLNSNLGLLARRKLFGQPFYSGLSDGGYKTVKGWSLAARATAVQVSGLFTIPLAGVLGEEFLNHGYSLKIYASDTKDDRYFALFKDSFHNAEENRSSTGERNHEAVYSTEQERSVTLNARNPASSMRTLEVSTRPAEESEGSTIAK